MSHENVWWAYEHIQLDTKGEDIVAYRLSGDRWEEITVEESNIAIGMHLFVADQKRQYN